MMKLSTMEKVVATVDEEWRSSLAEKILECWEHDTDPPKFVRSSANFIFIFWKDGQKFFLRFNDTLERNLKTIQAEIEMLVYLSERSLLVSAPVKSLHSRYVETVETEWGTFYATVFEGLKGEHIDFEEMSLHQIGLWGRSLGKLHDSLKKVPESIRVARPSWQDQLDFVQEMLSGKEGAAQLELEAIRKWANGLDVTSENFGLIHYDFELDNLCWNKNSIGILDFDDSVNHWYVADIGYALRDLFKVEINLDSKYFQSFIDGYKKETTLNLGLLQELSLFMRMHNLVTFAILLRSVDIDESVDRPEWLIGLREKLLGKIDQLQL